MVITGERYAEGGVRAVPKNGSLGCFTEMSYGKFRLKPLFYVTDADKAWYKDHYGIKYSDAYEVYGLTRTGCCGCPISCCHGRMSTNGANDWCYHGKKRGDKNA